MAEYRVWRGMIKRCTFPLALRWDYYGGRGVKVCDRWLASFADFLADVGPRPSDKHSLDRFPNNVGNYEPGNVRWATQKQQMNNRRDNVLVTVDGATRTVTEWHKLTKVPVATIHKRLQRGWDPEKAVKRPARRRRKLMLPFQRSAEGSAEG